MLVHWQQVWRLSPPLPEVGELRGDAELTESWDLLLTSSFVKNGLAGKALRISLGLAGAGGAAGSCHRPATRLCGGKGPRDKTHFCEVGRAWCRTSSLTELSGSRH